MKITQKREFSSHILNSPSKKKEQAAEMKKRSRYDDIVDTQATHQHTKRYSQELL